MVTDKNILKEIKNLNNWKRTSKRVYKVYMCKPEIGTECYNELEGVTYRTDENKQFILSGTVGETWVIDVNKLIKTYNFEDGTPITIEKIEELADKDTNKIGWTKLVTKCDGTKNWAFHIPMEVHNFPVETSWGDILYANKGDVEHLNGDFVLCCDDNNGEPNLNDIWVVNGCIFQKTYKCEEFDSVFKNCKGDITTVTPIKDYCANNSK